VKLQHRSQDISEQMREGVTVSVADFRVSN